MLLKIIETKHFANNAGGTSQTRADGYAMLTIIVAGLFTNDFQTLENLATVAPSMTLWSADQFTRMTWAFATLPFSSNRGSTCQMWGRMGLAGYSKGHIWITLILTQLITSLIFNAYPHKSSNTHTPHKTYTIINTCTTTTKHIRTCIFPRPPMATSGGSRRGLR